MPDAAAQEAAAPPADIPGCALLDRADGVNRAGVAVGWSQLNSYGEVDFTAFRIDMHGQWLAPIGVGGYAILPVSYGRIDPEVAGPTNAEWTLGDAELGAVARRRLAPNLEVAGHLGVTLPTAPEGTLGATEITGFANSFAIYARPNDLVQAFPQASYLRPGVALMHPLGGYFARVEGAVDVPVYSGTGEDLATIGRLNGAIGTRIGTTDLLFEVVNLIGLEKPDSEDTDRLLTFVGLTADFGVGRWQVQPSLSIPLDDEINDSVDLVFILGLQALLP